MKLSKQVTKTTILYFFFNRGKFPPGTTSQNWESLKMSEMQIDDPPLPSAPNYEKKKLSFQLQHLFNEIGYTLKSPYAIMSKASKTMKDLWEFCYENHEDMEGF